MAIVSTTLELYKSATVTGSPVKTINEQGSPAQVSLGAVSAGAQDALYPGSQYCVRARCTNDQAYTSDWTAARAFKTLISITWPETLGGATDVNLVQVNGEWTLNIGDITVDATGTDDGATAGTICYNGTDMSLGAVYVYVNNTNNIGTAVRFTTDAQGVGQGYSITNAALTAVGAQFSFQENSTYYVWLGVTDDAQDATRTYNTAVQTVSTGYAIPVVTISNPTHTYNSVGATVAVSSSEQITSVVAKLQATGGGTTYVKNLSTSSPQTVSFQNGDTDANSATVQIDPNTTYRLTIYAMTATYNTEGTAGTAYTLITTDSQAVSTIAITSVDNITPFAASVNLTYGS